MEGTDTPEDLVYETFYAGLDRENNWSGFERKEIDFLSTKEGLARMRTFVRRFKRKGGENGQPGDIDNLINELLKDLGVYDDEDGLLRNLLEGDDEDGWTNFKGALDGGLYETQNCDMPWTYFMLTLNKIGWVPEKMFI